MSERLNSEYLAKIKQSGLNVSSDKIYLAMQIIPSLNHFLEI